MMIDVTLCLQYMGFITVVLLWLYSSMWLVNQILHWWLFKKEDRDTFKEFLQWKRRGSE